MNSWTSVLVLACLLVSAGSARAAWELGGTPLDTQAGGHSNPRVVPDGLGGAYVVWTLANSQVRAQHLTSTGDPATGWGTSGMQIASNGLAHQLLGTGPDANNGLVVGMQENNISARAIRLQPDGSVAPGWGATGVLYYTYYSAGSGASDKSTSLQYFGSDFAGGAWFAVDTTVTACSDNCFGNGAMYAYHMSASGAVGGSLFVFYGSWGTRRQDGSTRPGSLIICSRSGDGVDAGVTRLSPTPQVSWFSGYYSGAHVVMYGSADDGAGGALVVMDGNPLYGYTDPPHLMRIDASGNVPVGWPAAGVPLPLPHDSKQTTVLADDGSGGILIGWTQPVSGGNELRVLRMTNAGVPAAGWPTGGVLLSAPGARQFRIAADGGGGVFAAWTDVRYDAAGDVYASHLNPDGTLDPSYAVNGSLVEAAPRGQGSVDIATVSPGHAILAWMDGRAGGSPVIYAQLLPPPPVTLDAPKHAAGGLSLAGFTPNPVRGAIRVGFRLVEQSDATLEVFDLLGRRVAGKDLAELPAGEHSIALDGAASLPNGVYLIRVRAGGQERIARGLIAR